MGKRLDLVIEEFNDLGNRLEAQYLEKRDEPTLDLVITLEDLKTILKGTVCIVEHEVVSIVGDKKKLTVKLERL